VTDLNSDLRRRGWHPLLYVAFLILLGYLFSNVEIQIEGPHGWAEELPTWRLDHHWLLNIVWGGRPVTGYHVYLFAFMALIFHLPLVMTGRFTLRLEARALGSIMCFWIIEDFLWFWQNPHYGLDKLFGADIGWHQHYILFLPWDYWIFSIFGGGLIWWSFRTPRQARTSGK